MNTAKLSPTQAKALDAIGRGAMLSYFGGRVRIMVPRERPFEVPAATIVKLRDLGLVEADAQGVRIAC